MRTLHKLTHRPLALMALFVGLGALGWQLPGLGSAALAYSRQAVQAARTTLIQRAPSTPAPVAAQPGAAKAAVARTAVQQTPGQQAVAAAKAALDAAVAARTAGKAGETAVDTALANYNAAVQVRLAEIRNRLNEIGVAINNPTTQNGVTRDNATGSNGAEYDALVAELKDLGGFPQAINAPAPVNINEVEPNDTSATAQNIALAGTVTQVSGSIGVAADADFYRVALTAGSKVWVYVDTGGTQTGGTSRDSQLTLLGTDGTTTLEFDDDDGTSNGGDNTVESGLGSAIGGFPITTTGNYFLKVNAFSATGLINPYKVFIVVTNAATTTFSETEPNDTAATANAFLSAAQTTAIVNGTCATNAIDFYTVTANAGDLLYVNLDGDPERNGTGTDVALSLRDSLGTTVFVTSDSSNGGTGPNPPSENFSFLFTTSGTFTLRVFGFGGTDPNVTYSLMGTLVTPSNACPPVAGITATLGGASTFPRVTGTQTQRLNRDGVTSACGVARTQAAPFAATRTFDAYTFPVGGVGTQCFTIGFAHSGTGTAEIMVGAYLNTFNPANMTQNWLGDFGFSITPAGAGTVNTFSVNAAAGNNIVIVVFDGGSAAGTAPGYNLQVSGNITGCATPCSITCPANITQNVDAGLCTAVVNYPAPTTSGTCNTVTCTPASGSTFAKGVTTVTCTSTGNLNGTATCSFTVTVVDNIPPTVAAVPDISVGTTGTGAVVTYTNPTATDNCPGVSAVTCTPPSGSTFAVGTTTVTCSATDAVNLTGSTTFRVFVNRLAVGSLSDPLACTGPGSKLSGSFTVTNNSAVSQNVAATVTLGPAGPPQSLLALSCTASAGTCTIAANQASLSYTATLAAGASATVSYILQVNDGVAQGTVLTSSVSATFNGGAAVTAGASTVANCALAGPGAPIITAAERTVMNDQRPGSILFYPIYTSDASGGGSQNARISLTNTSDKLATFVHLFFVDGSTCSVSDAFVCLTAGQTTAFLTSDLDPGTRGYLVAVATDAAGCPRHFNYLIGDEYVKFATGHRAALGAEAVAAIAGSTFWVSCDGSAPTAVLRFNSVDYGAVPYTLAEDNLQSTVDGNNTLLILNRIGGDLQTGPSRLVPIFGTMYDDGEVSYSFNLPTNNLCQFVSSLSDSVPRTTPRLSNIIPTGRTGWFKVSGTSEIGIFGASINFNPNTASSSGAYIGGHNLHKLTFTNAMTYTIPVFPPTC